MSGSDEEEVGDTPNHTRGYIYAVSMRKMRYFGLTVEKGNIGTNILRWICKYGETWVWRIFKKINDWEFG